MLESLLTVRDVCDLMKVKDARTARKIMRDMEHTEKPLLVTERAVKSWLARKMLPPESAARTERKGRNIDRR